MASDPTVVSNLSKCPDQRSDRNSRCIIEWDVGEVGGTLITAVERVCAIWIKAYVLEVKIYDMRRKSAYRVWSTIITAGEQIGWFEGNAKIRAVY